MLITVGVSARHVHLSSDVYEKLFTDKLEKLRNLDQPGQFAAKQMVSIKTDGGQIDNVRIVGPLRDYNQVEISRTDSYKLKVEPPVRNSSDLEGSLPITIIGPKGEVYLDKGLILANRHIHLTKEDALKYELDGISDVAVRINGEKSGILKNVYLKIQDNASLRLHLDTDDANAFGIKTDDEVEVIKIRERWSKWN